MGEPIEVEYNTPSTPSPESIFVPHVHPGLSRGKERQTTSGLELHPEVLGAGKVPLSGEQLCVEI